MKITEVRIFPTESRDGKLKAFATMTFDDWFVVRNVKIIQGNNGLFVAMPSRKALDSCQKCSFKNVRGSKYCNQCGAQLPQNIVTEEEGHDKQSSHMDIAHPISQECRVYIQDKILEAYQKDSGKNAAQSSSVKPEPAPAENVDSSEGQASSEEDQKQDSTEAPVSIDESKDIEL